MPSRALGSCLGAVLIAGLLACGDDDPKGPGDASTDGAVMDSGGIFIPRRDASVVPTDPIRPCDRWDPDSCPAGQTCDVLFRADEEQNVGLQQGCVTTTRERGLGDPCDPDFSAADPYETEGLTDLVWRDVCGPGLICAPDPKIRGGSSCQPSCVRGGRPEEPNQITCEDPRSFCVATNMRGPFRDFCVPSDGCDVVGQTGCAPGLACYLRTNDLGTGFLSVCFPPAPPEMVVPDGQPCDAYNACRPGSSCNGPLKKPIRSWDPDSDYICRSACSEDGSLPGGGDEDAGTEDGGTSSGGTCGSPRMCVSFASSGLSTSGITKPPYGQCE